jgi:NAD-dependent deacetylase
MVRSLYAAAMPIGNIVILTGAGVSAESGLATFRGPDGLWEGHRVEDV